jgi:hypothetical protein
MPNEENKNYYLKKKRTLMRTFKTALVIVKDILIEQFGDSKFEEISAITTKEFEELLPQIPYVGGDQNHLTESLINSALLLPFLRVFEKEGLNYEEIGKLTYDMFEAFFKVIPATDDIFSEEYIIKLKENAKKSKLRKYEGDWVYDFIEGDGETFTFGIDYYECGLYKFYKSQNAEHFMPIVCISDFAGARAYGYGLKRTQTIGNGAPICDFRFDKNVLTPRAWPPHDLPEFKKKL